MGQLPQPLQEGLRASTSEPVQITNHAWQAFRHRLKQKKLGLVTAHDFISSFMRAVKMHPDATARLSPELRERIQLLVDTKSRMKFYLEDGAIIRTVVKLRERSIVKLADGRIIQLARTPELRKRPCTARLRFTGQTKACWCR